MVDRQDFRILCEQFVQQENAADSQAAEVRKGEEASRVLHERLVKLRDELGRHVGANIQTKVCQIGSSAVIVRHCGTGAFNCTVEVVEMCPEG